MKVILATLAIAQTTPNSQVLFLDHNLGQKQAAQTAHKSRLISSLWRNLQGLGIWFRALSARRNEFALKIDSCIYSTLDKTFN